MFTIIFDRPKGGFIMKKTLFILPTLLLIVSVGCGPTAQQTSMVNDIVTEATTEETETTTKEPPTETLAVNEVGSLGDWDISITSFNIVDNIPYSYGAYAPDEGNKYAVAAVHIENKGKTPNKFLPSFSLSSDVRAKMTYGDGYEFTVTQLMGYDKDLHDTTLNPLSNADGEIVFTLPDTVVNDSGELILCFTQDNSELNFKVR